MPLSLPRPVLILVCGALVVLAAFMATRAVAPGDKHGGSTAAFAPSSAKPKAPGPAPKVPPAKAKAKAPASPAPAPPVGPPAPAHPAAPKTTRPAAPTSGPAAAERALSRGHVVVLFFSQSGADDAAASDAVRALRKRRDVEIFSDTIDRLGGYMGTVSELGISRAPAIVIVGPDKQARVLEGYVDAETVRQSVKDARR
jgi:hypothetical protein